MPGRHSHSVFQLWREVPDLAGRHVLDASVGEGTSTRVLVELGARVTATNFSPERDPRIPPEADYRALDLNAPWPFGDAEFDGVNLKDVLEHIENPAQTIREIARVLRPGGLVVISTPNVLNASSRLRFAATGFFEGRKRPISYAKPPGDAGNVYIPTLQLIHYLLAQYGLRIEAMATGAYAWKTLAAAVVCWPVLALGTTMATARMRRHDLLKGHMRDATAPEELDRLLAAQHAVQRDLRRRMLSRQVLLGRNLILRARKTGAGPFEF